MRPFLRYIRPAFPVLLVIVFGFHFGMTLAYLMPLNPIMLRIAPVVDGYMTPWFAQDWHLFAPNPITDTRILLVACRLRQADGRTVETAPANVSTPLWDAQARQRLSPAAALSQLQAHLIQLYLQQNEGLPMLEGHRTAEASAVSELADALRRAEGPRRALALHLLGRLGAAYCDQWYGAGQTVATQVRLTVLRFPRFSQRQLPDTAGELQSYPFDWMPYEQVAPLTGIHT